VGRAERRVNSEQSGELPEAEFISAEDFNPEGNPKAASGLWDYGGPAKESVEKQIALIEEFVAVRK